MAARILVVDDHPLVREGLAKYVASQPDMAVCGEASGENEALLQVRATHPDLALIDISLEDGHGLDLVKRVKAQCPEVKMLVLSGHDEALYAERALRAGAHGYINKRQCPAEIVEAIRRVLGGQRYLSAAMTERLVEQAVTGKGPRQAGGVAGLSDRELEVFRLIGEGLPTGAIARRLHLSVHTIDSHRENIRAKLNLKNSVELMRKAVEWVLNDPP